MDRLIQIAVIIGVSGAKVNIGATDLGYTEVKAIDEVPANAKVVIKGAYYLLSELTKGSGEEE